jgi:hypothetical protein
MPRARNAIASTAPRTPRIVTTRTPLFDEAGWREDGADLGEMRSGIFLARNLDDTNHVEMAGEIRFCAQRLLRCYRPKLVWILQTEEFRLFVICEQLRIASPGDNGF